MMDRECLRFSDISKSFGSHRVLKNASGSALQGQRILLLGANGSGKTTLLKILVGLLAPDQGEVSLASIAWPPKASKDRALIAWLPASESGFWPRLTGREALELYSRLWGVDPRFFHRVLADWSTSPAFRESLAMPTSQLSTGRRHLLHFARILMHQPQIILTDEPFRSLDEANQQLVLTQIETWAPEALVIVSSPTPSQAWNWQQTWTFADGSLK
jgi:ABC-2 type transport system ATP-binding protein